MTAARTCSSRPRPPRFDFARFYAECRRVLVPGGAVALWTYEKFRAGDAVDAVVDEFYDGVIGPYWPPERRYVEQAYRTLPFLLSELPAPALELATEWDLDRLMGYLATWSAVQRFRERRGIDPLPALRSVLIGFGLIWLSSRFKPAAPTETNVTLNIDLPANVEMDSFKCKSCGVALTTDNIKMVAGAPVVTCPYCGSIYQLTEEPKW